MTMKSITKIQIIDLFKSLSAIMGADTLYLTQEMALEVICRIVHFILSHNSSVMEEVLKVLPEALQEQLSEGASSISSTLLDMRPYLNALNERNPSITSARFTSMEWTDLLSNGKEGKASQIKESGWLDICGDVMCLQTISTHSFVRFEYSLLGSCRVSKSSGSLEIIITGGVEKLLSVVQFTSRGPKAASSHAGKLSIKMTVASKLESLERKLASQIKASNKENESEQREEMAKYSVVSNKTNVVSDRSNAGQEVSSISSPDFTNKEEGLHTGQNKDEKIKDSLLQIQDDRNNPKIVGDKKRKAAGSAKSETKPPQDKRMRTERTPAKPEPKSAVKSTTKSSASKRSPRANMSSSRVNASDWNDDNEQGGERRVEEEEMCNYEDQLNTSYYPEPLHPLDDPELLPAHPLPFSSFVSPPQPPLEFEAGSKAVKPIGKENEVNTVKEQTVKSSKTIAKAISDTSIQDEESREKARGSRMRFASNKENEEDQVRVVSSRMKKTDTVPETPAESQPYISYPFKPPSSAEPSEDEDVEMNSAGAGGQISLNDSSSNEEATVLTNIINEILMMQQERLQRKRMKLVTTLCEETEKQLKLFINQWIEYCFDTCTDSYLPLLGNLAEVEKNSQELVSSAQLMLDKSSASNDRFKGVIANMESQYNAVQRDAQDMHNRILAERDKLQNDMRKLRSHYLSQAKSLVSVSAKGLNPYEPKLSSFILRAFTRYYQGSAENQKIVNEGASFATLTSVHVADLYSRVSGLPPLTWQDSANLPGVDLLASDNIARPQIVEIVGDVLPNEIQEIARTRSNNIPALEEVVSVLRDNGVEGVVTKRFEASSNKLGEVKDYLSSQPGPVLVLHTAQSLPSASRRLQVNGVPELDERQISQYQICLWVGVVFVLLGIFSICGIANMDVEPDSLLYAKFQSARTDGKRD
eukprot:gene28688-34634_t